MKKWDFQRSLFPLHLFYSLLVLINFLLLRVKINFLLFFLNDPLERGIRDSKIPIPFPPRPICTTSTPPLFCLAPSRPLQHHTVRPLLAGVHLACGDPPCLRWLRASRASLPPLHYSDLLPRRRRGVSGHPSSR